jgi:hypothetical protein
VVNATAQPLPLAWEIAPAAALGWSDADGKPIDATASQVPPRGWLWGRAAR